MWPPSDLKERDSLLTLKIKFNREDLLKAVTFLLVERLGHISGTWVLIARTVNIPTSSLPSSIPAATPMAEPNHKGAGREAHWYDLFFFFFFCGKGRLFSYEDWFILFYFLLFFYCSGFCHTLKWNSHGFTCVPHSDPPSHLPLHPIPLGLPSAPGPSDCLMHPAWAGDLFHPR